MPSSLNQYANFASVIDTGNDAVIGQFETDFYGEDLVFNANGTRLYLTDRFNDQVRAFRIDPGPSFTQIADDSDWQDRSRSRESARSRDQRRRHDALRGQHARPHDRRDQHRRRRQFAQRGLPVGGLATDVKVAGRWGIVSGHSTNSVLNAREIRPWAAEAREWRRHPEHRPAAWLHAGHERRHARDHLRRSRQRAERLRHGHQPLRLPLRRLRARPIDHRGAGTGRRSRAITRRRRRSSAAAAPSSSFVKGDLLFVSQLHSDKVEVFRINQNPASPSQILTHLGPAVHRRHHAAGSRGIS